MESSERERQLYGSSVTVIKREADKVIYRVCGEDGEAVLTSYQVFPGIELIYNEVHMSQLTVDTVQPANIFEINHCREGRIECETNQGEYMYLSKGDLAINTKNGLSNSSSFPLVHYHGITVAIDIDQTPDCLSCILDDVVVSVTELRNRICKGKEFHIIRENEWIEHIFSELYVVPEHIRKGYQKIKVLELLLFLNGLRPEELETHKRYFTKMQIDTVKEIKAYLIADLSRRITLKQLAEKFGMPLTTMKLCFKEIYGNSIYAFLKKYKMQQAAELLMQKEYTILSIAGMLGYDNASKFSDAFKHEIGLTPSEYRLKFNV